MMVRSLDNIQRENEKCQTQHDAQINHTVYKKYPWAIQNNSLPNYFLAANQGDEYQNGAVVFMHHHRSAGTAIRYCMEDIAERKSLASSPVMGSDDRFEWDNKHGLNSDFRDKLKFHRGQYSFGMCNELDRDCSHFTLLRDPMERAQSSYEYCKQAYGDEMCKVVNANDMTLRQWVIHHGSLTFQQMVFQSQWCHLVNKSEPKVVSQAPCWYRHKRQLDKLTGYDYKHLVEYVVNNMEKWFSVIGIYEDLNNSLLMFEHVYNLPFSKCQNLKKFDDSNSNINDNRSNRKKTRGGSYDDNDPEYLKYDYEVQQALDADWKIYKKARKIFQLQKQILLNRLGR